MPSDTNVTCSLCGQPADTVVRSERHVRHGFVLIHRARQCATGHTTLTHAREYEETVDTYATDLVVTLIPLESEAAVHAT